MGVKKHRDEPVDDIRSRKLGDTEAAEQAAAAACVDPVTARLAAQSNAPLKALENQPRRRVGRPKKGRSANADSADGDEALPGSDLNAPASGHLSQYETYELRLIDRATLKAAPYNPRVMDDHAKKKLRANIEKVGLVEPPVWNERTGNIVSGHQRLSQLDALHGGQDYKLHVAVVQLTAKQEREQNVFMNNPSVQGDWAFEKLDALFKDQDVPVDHKLAGFDDAEFFQMFGDNILAETPESLIELSKQFRDVTERYARTLEDIAERDVDDFYAVVVFNSPDRRFEFTDMLDMPDSRFINGESFWTMLEAYGVADHVNRYSLLLYTQEHGAPTCPRCGEVHSFSLHPMRNADDTATHWALCHDTNEPILLTLDEEMVERLEKELEERTAAAQAEADAEAGDEEEGDGDEDGDGDGDEDGDEDTESDDQEDESDEQDEDSQDDWREDTEHEEGEDDITEEDDDLGDDGEEGAAYEDAGPDEEGSGYDGSDDEPEEDGSGHDDAMTDPEP